MTSESIICPSCSRTVDTLDNFCPWCGKPLTTFATTDSLQVIRAEGEMLRTSMQRPTFIIWLGIVLLFGPPILFFLIAPFYILLDESSGPFVKIFGFVGCGFFAWLYFAIVRKVTRGYLISRTEPVEQSRDQAEK
jgi:RNA polymerase subunit RPABC4/transcription elongation factor Spt4